jgi:ribosomal protein S18 acetylase RimI-like enzyme
VIDGRLRPGRSIASDYLGAMLEDCRRYAGEILVLDADGAVVGFATVLARVPFERLEEPPGEYAVVSQPVVRRAERRRGHARALLSQAERHAASLGAAELRIAVSSANSPARALYHDVGFRPYLETLTKPSTGR